MTSIAVHVGETATLIAHLSVSETISVSGEADIMDHTKTKTETSTLVTKEQISQLPIKGRRVDQFALLTPGVVQDGVSGEMSFHGIPAGNQFLQDGVDVTQQWFVGNAGGSAVLSNISQHADRATERCWRRNFVRRLSRRDQRPARPGLSAVHLLAI